MITEEQLKAQGQQIARELHEQEMRAYQSIFDELGAMQRATILKTRVFPATYDKLNRLRIDEVNTLNELHMHALAESYIDGDDLLATLGRNAVSNPPTDAELNEIASVLVGSLLRKYHYSEVIEAARDEIPQKVDDLQALLSQAKDQYTDILDDLNLEQTNSAIGEGRLDRVRRRLPLTSPKKTKRLANIEDAEQELKQLQQDLMKSISKFRARSMYAMGPEFRVTILQLDRLNAYATNAIAAYRNAVLDDANDPSRRNAAFANFKMQRDRIANDLIVDGQNTSDRAVSAFNEMRDRVREKYYEVLQQQVNQQEIMRVLRSLELNNIAGDATRKKQAIAALQATFARMSQQAHDELVAEAKMKGKAAMIEFKKLCDSESKALAKDLQARAMRKYHPAARVEADGHNLAILSSGPRSANPRLGDHVEIDATSKFTRSIDKITGLVNECISISSLPSNHQLRMKKLLKAAELWAHGMEKKHVNLSGIATAQDPSGQNFDRRLGLFTGGLVGYCMTKPKSSTLHAAEATAVLEYLGVAVSGYAPHSTAEQAAYDKAKEWVKRHYVNKANKGLVKAPRDLDTVSEENLDPNLILGRRRTDFSR